MRYRVLLALWLFADVLLFIGCYAAAYAIRVGFILSTDFPFDRHLTATFLAAPPWLLVLLTTRSFHLTRNQMTLRSGAYIAYSALVGAALFTLIYYFTFNQFFSRLLIIEAFLLSTFVVWGWHIVFEQILRRVLRMHPPVFPTLIVGITRESQAMIATLNRRKHPLFPVAVLDVRGIKDIDVEGVPYLGRLNKLEETLTRFRPTHLIHASDMEQSLNLLSACKNKGIAYIVLPSVFGIVNRDERVESLEGHPVTVVPPENSRWSWFFR